MTTSETREPVASRRERLRNLAFAIAMIALAAALWFGVYWLVPLESHRRGLGSPTSIAHPDADAVGARFAVRDYGTARST